MRVLLDTNIVLDVLLARIPWQREADAIFLAAREHRFSAAVTALSIANVFYVGRRHAGLERAKQAVRACLDALEVLAVDRITLEAAIRFTGSDLEDNIQIAAAIEAGVDAIVTRDPGGFAASPLAILTPEQLLASLSEPPSSSG